MHTWKCITHTSGTLMAHTHTWILTYACHFLPIFSHSCPGELVDAGPGLLVSSSSALTAPLSASPTPEKVQLRGPQGCTGNALHTMGQPGYFLSQNWREAGLGVASHDSQLFSASFSVAFSLPLQFAVFVCLSCLYLLSVFLFMPQSLSDPLSFASFHLTIHTLQNSALCHLFQKAFPDPSYPIWAPLPFASKSSEQDALRELHCVDKKCLCLLARL